MSRRSAGIAALLAVACTIGAALAPTTPALADARYNSSSPGKGEILAAAPSLVAIVFTQKIQTVDRSYGIQVNRERGSSVTAGTAVVDEDRRGLSVTLSPDLGPGRYVVRWQDVSDDDGHAATGAFSFYVKRQPNTIDLDNDRQLESVGAQAETPGVAATASPRPSPPASTPPATAAGGETRPGATRPPRTSAANPTATPAMPSSGGGNTALTVVFVVTAVIVVAVLVGGAAWRMLSTRRR